MDSVLALRTVLIWTFVLSILPSFTHTKPLDKVYNDAEIRKQIITAAERVLEKRLDARSTLQNSQDEQGTLAQGLILQKKQDEPSPFFGGDYAYDRWSRRAKKAWLHADREQDEPSPMFPSEKRNEQRLKKTLGQPPELPASHYDDIQKKETQDNEDTNQLINKLVDMWHLSEKNAIAKKRSKDDGKISMADILDLLKSQ